MDVYKESLYKEILRLDDEISDLLAAGTRAARRGDRAKAEALWAEADALGERVEALEAAFRR